MKADVLNIFEEIQVCTAYEMPDGTVTDQIPFEITDIKVKPIYASLPGWHCSLEGMRDFNELPAELTNYIAFLEKHLNLPINFISTGPDREACVLRGSLA